MRDNEEEKLAIVLEGVNDRFQMNVLQLLARRTSIRVTVDGYGTVEPTAYVITRDQARHLATQITELLGTKIGRGVHAPFAAADRDRATPALG